MFPASFLTHSPCLQIKRGTTLQSSGLWTGEWVRMRGHSTQRAQPPGWRIASPITIIDFFVDLRMENLILCSRYCGAQRWRVDLILPCLTLSRSSNGPRLVLPHLISGQFIEHGKPSILQRVQSSSMLHFSRDIRVHSLVTLLRGPRLSSVPMGFE